MQKFINDTKNSIDVIKAQQEQYLKEQSEEFDNEKQILNEKIKNAEKDCETTEIEITKLNEQNTQLENSLNELKNKYNDLENELKEAQDELDKEIDDLKNKLNSINRDINVNCANYEKEVSLKEQKIDFLNKKLEDIKNELNTLKESFEDKINQTKENITKEYTEKIESIKKEKENLESIINNLEKYFFIIGSILLHLSPTMNFANFSIWVGLATIAITKTSMQDHAFNISAIA